MIQAEIKLIKDKFEQLLALKLGLTRVSAPLFVEASSGLNDYLGLNTKPITFRAYNTNLEIVQSLAKWKRLALKEYQLDGLYVDMNAIRPNEVLDNLHSLYVDQWDWEKKITKEERNMHFLFLTVKKIYEVLKEAENFINSKNDCLTKKLPKDIFFISSLELFNMYPKISPKKREEMITSIKKAVFIYEIGDLLPDGKTHSDRAEDYDDWHLNGDLLVWSDVISAPIELSSMGIRVDRESFLKQCKTPKRVFYHEALLSSMLPLSIGGGIGQSRIAMFLLEKQHIGEVQVSWWPEEERKDALMKGIKLL